MQTFVHVVVECPLTANEFITCSILGKKLFDKTNKFMNFFFMINSYKVKDHVRIV